MTIAVDLGRKVTKQIVTGNHGGGHKDLILCMLGNFSGFCSEVSPADFFQN